MPLDPPSSRRAEGCSAPDDGGVWIVTGWVLGFLVYIGVVLMVMAGFTAALPLVVVPPVLVCLIGASNLLGGGRTHGHAPARPGGSGRAPLSSGGGPVPGGTPDGLLPPEGRPASGDEP